MPLKKNRLPKSSFAKARKRKLKSFTSGDVLDSIGESQFVEFNKMPRARYLLQKGLNARRLKYYGFSLKRMLDDFRAQPADLKLLGFTAKDFKEEKFGISVLNRMGFPLKEVVGLYPFEELGAFYPAINFKRAGVPAGKLKGVFPFRKLEGVYPLKELLEVFSPQDLLREGLSVNAVNALMTIKRKM